MLLRPFHLVRRSAAVVAVARAAAAHAEQGRGPCVCRAVRRRHRQSLVLHGGCGPRRRPGARSHVLRCVPRRHKLAPQVSLYDVARGCYSCSIDCSAQVNGVAGARLDSAAARAFECVSDAFAAFKLSAPGGIAACADGGECRRNCSRVSVGADACAVLRVFDVRTGKVERCLFDQQQQPAAAAPLLSCCIMADDQVAAGDRLCLLPPPPGSPCACSRLLQRLVLVAHPVGVVSGSGGCRS